MNDLDAQFEAFQREQAGATSAPTAAQLAHHENDKSGPVLIRMSDVKPTPIKWLWRGRIPLGRTTLLVGRPGEGKSLLTTDMAARVTTGTPWPDGSPCPKGSVILISAEDDPGDTIRPRLDAHGADASKVHLLVTVRRMGDDGNPFDVMFTLADLPALEEALKRVPDCVLIIIDPIGSFIGGKTDAHRDNEVRGVLAPVAQLAEKYGPAVLIVAHRRKGGGDFADDTALGSRAFTGIARATWHLSRDEQNKARRLLLPGKNNLAPEGDGLAFTIAGDPPAIHWERDPVKLHADDVMQREGGDGDERTECDDAAEWLRALLADGPRRASDVERDAKDAGYSIATVRRAKAAIGVVSRKPTFGGPWEWALPAPAEDAQTPKALTEDAHSAEGEHLGANPAENIENHPKALTNGQVSILGEHLGHEKQRGGDGWGQEGVIE